MKVLVERWLIIRVFSCNHSMCLVNSWMYKHVNEDVEQPTDFGHAGLTSKQFRKLEADAQVDR